MKWLRTVVSLLLAAAIFWAVDNRHGQLPPAGRLLDPFTGYCRSGDGRDKPPALLKTAGLKDDVRIEWDERFIPHIFAANEHDLYFAQGYVCAYLRLWQMEFQAYYASGRLAEIAGRKALESDRFQRRFGMLWAAEKSLRAMEKDPVVKAAVEAYSDGVNAYIASLNAGTLPIEYKILDYRPERWTPLKSAILLKYVSYMLAGRTRDAQMTRMRDALGDKVLDELFPRFTPMTSPVIPTAGSATVGGGAGTGVRSGTRPVGGGAGGAAAGRMDDLTPDGGPADGFPLESDAHLPLALEPAPEIGSNNWAVSGSRTASGFPILANDMHLGLSLPAIWYALQLHAPGVNVMGVTFAGSPMVVAGFNDKAAWGFTNAGSDVIDWYAVRFRDASKTEYACEGGWEKTSVREELIKVRGGKPVTERIIFTKQGPVVRDRGDAPFSMADIPEDAALRWTGHDAADEMRTLYLLDRAGSYEDYLKALEYWACPAQNFAWADASGDIAIRHNGALPLRSDGRGAFILDASKAGDKWTGFIPRAGVPNAKDPARGYVSSANQEPVDASYPYYLGRDYAGFERGNRINEVLEAGHGITAADMVRLQNDVLDIRARAILPRFLETIRKLELGPVEKQALGELEKWDCEERASAVGPSVFNEIWKEFNARTFDDEKKGDMQKMTTPLSQVVIDLVLRHPDSAFFDDKTTEKKETLNDMIEAAFRAAVKGLEKRRGPFGERWKWGRVKATRLAHLAAIPGLGLDYLEADGAAQTVDAISTNWAPSWRMVVELGPELKAWGVYPGGQSGDPGSKHYDDYIGDWAAGRSYELLFMRSPESGRNAIKFETVMRGAR